MAQEIRKRTVVFLTAFFLIGLAIVPFSAFGEENVLPYVIDAAGVLTAAQAGELEKKASQMTEKYRCEVRIVILNNIGELLPIHASNALYVENEFGYGSDRSVVLFLLSIEDRQFDLAVWGFGDIAFTERGKDVILDKHILPLLKNDNFYEAFTAYLDKTEEYLALAAAGTPFDSGTNNVTNLIARIGIIILLPLLIAAHICLYWKKKMKTAVTARRADNYISAGGLTITGRQDDFLYRTTRQVKIETGSRRGGSLRSSRSGSGGSHRSGRF